MKAGLLPFPDMSEAALQTSVAKELLEDVRQAMEQDPQAARVAAIRLVDFLTEATQVQAIGRGGLAPWRKRKIERYLRENLDRRLSLESLAAHVSLSVSQFSRAFRGSFGTTPRRHILRLKLDLAKQLMLTTDDPLSQIALACGSADQAHLSKLFRRAFGEPPSAWRRRNQEEAPTGSGGD